MSILLVTHATTAPHASSNAAPNDITPDLASLLTRGHSDATNTSTANDACNECVVGAHIIVAARALLCVKIIS